MNSGESKPTSQVLSKRLPISIHSVNVRIVRLHDALVSDRIRKQYLGEMRGRLSGPPLHGHRLTLLDH